jgi:hypothetical protein
MWKSPQLEMYEEGEADHTRHPKLDSAEEIRCNVWLQSARYIQGVRHYHDRNVNNVLSMFEIWCQTRVHGTIHVAYFF